MNEDDNIFSIFNDDEAQKNGDQFSLECYLINHKISTYKTIHELDTGETE